MSDPPLDARQIDAFIAAMLRYLHWRQRQAEFAERQRLERLRERLLKKQQEPAA